MASVTWPGSLPQELLLDELEVQFPRGGVRSTIDRPIVQQRERYNASVTLVEATLELTVAQYITFLDFWSSTLGYGSIPFDWVHPITGAAAEMRFKPSAPPSFSGSSGSKVYVDITLEILP